MHNAPRHLDVADAREADTLCGAVPMRRRGDGTLTRDPAAVTCEDCRRAYALARLEHQILGRTAARGALGVILAEQDAAARAAAATVVHLDAAPGTGEIATECGSFPDPAPSPRTLTRDPARVTCPACLAASRKVRVRRTRR